MAATPVLVLHNGTAQFGALGLGKFIRATVTFVVPRVMTRGSGDQAPQSKILPLLADGSQVSVNGWETDYTLWTLVGKRDTLYLEDNAGVTKFQGEVVIPQTQHTMGIEEGSAFDIAFPIDGTIPTVPSMTYVTALTG